MKPKHAFLLALIFTVLIATNVFLLSQDTERREVTIKRVLDGDTFETNEGEKIRLVNINTPEKSRHGFEEATDFLKSYEGQIVEIEDLGFDTYSRTLARVYSPEYINLEIIKQGLGKKFLVQEDELYLFSAAEEEAIQNQRGMWIKSIYFSCFGSEIMAEEEQVILESHCEEINIQGWVLTDESRKEYVFKQTINNKLILLSGEGFDNENTVFWNQKQAVWNNDRDTLYLFDTEGNIAHYNPYGY